MVQRIYPEWDRNCVKEAGPEAVRLDISPEGAFEICKEVDRFTNLNVPEGIASYEVQDHLTPSEQLSRAIAMYYWDMPTHVVVYATGQSYGGPEEGGWWYTTYEVAEKFLVDEDNWAAIVEKAESLCKSLRKSLPERGSSHRDGGWSVTIETTSEPGYQERYGRPHYE